MGLQRQTQLSDFHLIHNNSYMCADYWLPPNIHSSLLLCWQSPNFIWVSSPPLEIHGDWDWPCPLTGGPIFGIRTGIRMGMWPHSSQRELSWALHPWDHTLPLLPGFWSISYSHNKFHTLSCQNLLQNSQIWKRFFLVYTYFIHSYLNYWVILIE